MPIIMLESLGLNTNINCWLYFGTEWFMYIYMNVYLRCGLNGIRGDGGEFEAWVRHASVDGVVSMLRSLVRLEVVRGGRGERTREGVATSTSRKEHRDTTPYLVRTIWLSCAWHQVYRTIPHHTIPYHVIYHAIPHDALYTISYQVCRLAYHATPYHVPGITIPYHTKPDIIHTQVYIYRIPR